MSTQKEKRSWKCIQFAISRAMWQAITILCEACYRNSVPSLPAIIIWSVFTMNCIIINQSLYTRVWICKHYQQFIWSHPFVLQAFYSVSFSHHQLVALALLLKFAAFLSMGGYLWIILEVIGDKAKQKELNHCILLGCSSGNPAHVVTDKRFASRGWGWCSTRKTIQSYGPNKDSIWHEHQSLQSAAQSLCHQQLSLCSVYP